ncbi:MAG: bacteriocin immunity protein [Enterococcus sp.]|uniref:bacteriocin immunity protein n=1 Tax=Enterococcus sp. TaxID=35783 RepID=UPI00399560B4
MKPSKETEVLTDIDTLLAPDMSDNEREILLHAKEQLAKNDYLPKIIGGLADRLSPLAMQSQLTKPVGEFYLKISGRHFLNKGPAGGLINALQNKFL